MKTLALAFALLFVALTFREWVGEKTRNDSWGWVAENVPWERGMGWAKTLPWEKGMGFLRRFAAVREEKKKKEEG